MALTDEEKQSIIEAVLAEVKGASTGIEDLEEVSSLDNIRSLPGFSDTTLVIVPISLLQEPATVAAEQANKAATSASEAASTANSAAATANEAASKANTAAETATNAASTYGDTATEAHKGATVRFGGIESYTDISLAPFVEAGGTTVTGGSVVFSTALNTFLYKVGGKYYSSWDVDGIPSMGMFMENLIPLKDKLYISDDGTVYVWSETEDTLSQIGKRLKILTEDEYEQLTEKDDSVIYLTFEEDVS